jgi:hypothetical protein
VYTAIQGTEPGCKTVYCDFAADVFCINNQNMGMFVHTGPLLNRLFKVSGKRITHLVMGIEAWLSFWPSYRVDLRAVLDLKKFSIVLGFPVDIRNLQSLEDPDGFDDPQTAQERSIQRYLGLVRSVTANITVDHPDFNVPAIGMKDVVLKPEANGRESGAFFKMRFV